MSYQKIGPSTYLLWIDDAAGTNWRLVACLNNFGFSGSTSTNDASSMCGPDNTAGDTSYDIPLDAQYIITPEAGKFGPSKIFDLWQNKTTITWKIGKAVPAAGDITKTGTGYFSKYDEKFDSKSTTGFSGTITGKGTVSQDVNGESGS